MIACCFSALCLCSLNSLCFMTIRVEAGAVILSHVPHVRDQCWGRPGTWNTRLSLLGSWATINPKILVLMFPNYLRFHVCHLFFLGVLLKKLYDVFLCLNCNVTPINMSSEFRPQELCLQRSLTLLFTFFFQKHQVLINFLTVLELVFHILTSYSPVIRTWHFRQFFCTSARQTPPVGFQPEGVDYISLMIIFTKCN